MTELNKYTTNEPILSEELDNDPDTEDISKTIQFFSTSTDESLEKKGIILLEDESVYPGITLNAKKLVLDIASNPDGPSTIEIYINSNGGEIMQFLSLHDAILLAQKFYNKKIVTIVNGIAASAAAISLQAGNTRMATKNSYIMIHEISFGFEGKFTNAREELTSVKKMQNTAFKIWADKMGISVKELFEIIGGKDIYYSAKEAKTKGLIDVII